MAGKDAKIAYLRDRRMRCEMDSIDGLERRRVLVIAVFPEPFSSLFTALDCGSCLAVRPHPVGPQDDLFAVVVDVYIR